MELLNAKIYGFDCLILVNVNKNEAEDEFYVNLI